MALFCNCMLMVWVGEIYLGNIYPSLEKVALFMNGNLFRDLDFILIFVP